METMDLLSLSEIVTSSAATILVIGFSLDKIAAKRPPSGNKRRSGLLKWN
jgi:hypothetical protein